MIKYQVFVNSVYGSDIVEFDTYEEALAEAKKWQTEVDEEVVILKITEEEIKWKLN